MWPRTGMRCWGTRAPEWLHFDGAASSGAPRVSFPGLAQSKVEKRGVDVTSVTSFSVLGGLV
jgi:hypothetical protein